MQTEIENGKLGQVIDLLFGLSLKGKQSRHRTKFIKQLNERLKEVEEQRQDLAKEHSNHDENGEAKTNDGNYDIKDMEAFRKDVEELFQEEMVVEGGDAQGMLTTLKKVLKDCDEEWSRQQAMTFDYLCEQFGVDEEE